MGMDGTDLPAAKRTVRGRVVPAGGAVGAVVAVVLWNVGTFVAVRSGLEPPGLAKVVAFVGLFGTLVALSLFDGGAQPRPARFTVVPGIGFAVPPIGGYAVSVTSDAVLIGWCVNFLILLRPLPANPDVGVAVDITNAVGFIVTWATVGAFILLFIIDLRRALNRPPQLMLTPEGLRQSGRLRYQTVRWRQLLPQQPLPGIGERAVVLPLRSADRPNGARPARKPKLVLDLFACQIDPRFLHNAIQYYIHRPDQQQTIGTTAGYQQLLADLAHQPQPPVDAAGS
jgi:hypothetical protein